MVRCFIGIMIPGEIRKRVISLQNELRALPMRCKFVEPDNLHISLSFLGEISENEVERISNKLDVICNGFKPFQAYVAGLRTIPSKSYFRVLALDVKSDGIEKLSKDVKRKIGGSVHPPHLTLCRVKSVEKKEDVIKWVEERKNVDIGSFVVSDVKLVKSELSRSGPRYTVLHESKFRP